MTGAGKRILVIYSWPKIWSMGPGRGSPDFYLSLKSLASVSERVVVVHPAGPEALAGAPESVEAAGFRSLIPERLVPTPACLREGRLLGLKKCLRAGLFALNWLIRLAWYCYFTVAAYRAGTRAAEKLGPSLVAAFGCTAVPAARLLASRYRLPLVVRLFGVSLGMRGFSLLEQAAKFDETLSFRLRADRWVITDDGSAGDEAARRLGVPGSRVVFPLCGVERPALAEEFDRG
ncbi:MAG: hypothetical protein JXQ83_05575, partial [Candidatus Glassbacteria bacterium]|nr:hypothetical protein [Candidatus Glassbacteria bacterium]